MSDALGGLVNIGLIVFFITIIALYLAFNVNYQKAFNVKNEIVSVYEEYQGKCNSECKEKIADYEEKLGYGKLQLTETDGEKCFNVYGYCIKGYESKKNSQNLSVENDKVKYCYFSIRTNVLIDIPYINKMLNLRVFHVTGQTKSMKLYVKNKSVTCQDLAEAG